MTAPPRPPTTPPAAGGLLRRAVLGAVASAGAVYAGLVGALWFGQEKLIFLPQSLPPDHRFGHGADVHETWIDVPGARLHALHLRLPAPDGVVFYLHGNAGNLDGWFANPAFYRQANVDLVMLDYRGYGKSSGRIDSQGQLEADVRAAWNAVAPGYAGRKRVILGRSLGSALAATLAAEVQPELTVLVSPYTSMTELAKEHYPWVPGSVLRYPLRTGDALERIRGRVLLLHGRRDVVIGPHHSEALFTRAADAELVLLPEAGHNDIHLFDGYLTALRRAIAAR